VIINPQADARRNWGDQGRRPGGPAWSRGRIGITIRGAKMLGTSSIMANEVFVANLQPLKAGEEDLAFCARCRWAARGCRALAQVLREQRRLGVDNPTVLAVRRERRRHHFDDVKVDWIASSCTRDVDMCRAQFHDTPGHIFQITSRDPAWW